MDSQKTSTYLTHQGETNVNVFDNELVALYFSAHWCPPCKQFTPVLAQFYNDVNSAGKKFEIVFVSSDQSQEEFASYFGTMPFIALPFGDARIAQLKTQHNVSGIPCLVVLKKDGTVLSQNARQDVAQYGPKAYDNWIAASKN